MHQLNEKQDTLRIEAKQESKMARKVIMDDEPPEITAEMFANMRPMKDVTPGMAQAIKALRLFLETSGSVQPK